MMDSGRPGGACIRVLCGVVLETEFGEGKGIEILRTMQEFERTNLPGMDVQKLRVPFIVSGLLCKAFNSFRIYVIVVWAICR